MPKRKVYFIRLDCRAAAISGMSQVGPLVFEQIFAAEQYERFKNAAALVAHNADVLVVVTRSATIAAQRATATIPIVFTVVRRNIDGAKGGEAAQHSCGAACQLQGGPLFDTDAAQRFEAI